MAGVVDTLGDGGGGVIVERDIEIEAAGVVLSADIVVPERPRGVVLFAHGTGSGRYSPRNRFVANELNDAGLATVLADLLTPVEAERDAVTAGPRFNIGVLATRVIALIDRVVTDPDTSGLGVGLFGGSTGAAAALIAAAERPDVVRAVVSRGGRPDLAGEMLREVRQPTLLIVGQRDTTVLDLNQDAMKHLDTEVRLEIVPGATHLFEEPGALAHVAHLARDWFYLHLHLHQQPEPQAE